MKNILMTLIMTMMSITMNAQLYIGGSLGLGSVKFRGGETADTYKIIPEIGYGFNNNWAVGLSLGYKKGACLVGSGSYNQNVTSKAVGIQPYVRYYAFNTDYIHFFVDGIYTYEKIIDEGTNMNFGITPGLSFVPTKHLSIVAHFGFVGLEIFKPKNNVGKSGVGGFEFDGSNLALGMYYLF